MKEQVYEPAEKLIKIFKEKDSRFVAFIEVAELEIIEAKGADSDIDKVKHQIQELYGDGFELGLHLHPQWYNARHENGKWQLDYSEYNLCTLPRERIARIVKRSMDYLRNVLAEPDFTPLSFRAGNWLFQPTKNAADVLAEQGIRIDSSVFKGGLQHNHGLDYRPASKNGYYWRFGEDVNTHDFHGRLIELPTHSVMVPIWKMITRKRVGGWRASLSSPESNGKKRSRYLDFFRFWYPLKLDFCRMTFVELKHLIDSVICEDQEKPTMFRPIVAIGHTKDLKDFETVEKFLSYLGEKEIPVSTFKDIYLRCKS